MKGLGATIISTALAGLIMLVPLAILFLAGLEVYGLLEDMAAFTQLQLPFPAVVNALIFIVAAVAALFTACLFFGLLLTTGAGKKLANFIENGIAEKIPLLGLVRNLTLSLTGAGSSQLQAAEINLHGSGTCSYGFVMEVLPDGRNIVFIPSAPAVTLGQTFIVAADRVTLLDAPITAVVNTITQWGTGASEIYKPRP
jgi:uncharacterized membrane protein